MWCQSCRPEIQIRRWVHDKIWRISNLLKKCEVRTLSNSNSNFVTSLVFHNGTFWVQMYWQLTFGTITGHRLIGISSASVPGCSASDPVLTDQTHGRRAWCDSVSDADIRRVDGRRRSLSRTLAFCTPYRCVFLPSVNNSNAVATCEIKSFRNYFSLRRRPFEIVLPEIIAKLFRKLTAAHEYFPARRTSPK